MSLADRVAALAAYFNRGLLDVPDGLLTRDTAYRLNGVSYEAWLGRSEADALVRLVARGPAGYRFAAQGVLRAIERVHVTVATLAVDGGQAVLSMTLEGTLRGETEPARVPLTMALTLAASGTVDLVEITIAEAARARIAVARGA